MPHVAGDQPGVVVAYAWQAPRCDQDEALLVLPGLNPE